MNRTWRIRPYREGDEHQIVQLRKTVFGDVDAVRLNISTWNWRIILNFHRTLLCPLITTKIERIPPFEKGGPGMG
jgi:hypothetical protein